MIHIPGTHTHTHSDLSGISFYVAQIIFKHNGVFMAIFPIALSATCVQQQQQQHDEHELCLEYFRTRLHTCSTCCCRCPRQFRGVRLKCRSSVAPAVAPLAPSAPLRRVYSVASQSHFAIVASVAASVVVDSSVLCLGSAFVFGFAFSHEANAARASSIARHGTAQWPRRKRSRNLKFSEYRNRNRSLLCLPLSLSLSLSQSQSGSVCFSDNESERPSGGNSFCAALCVCCVVIVIQANVVCVVLCLLLLLLFLHLRHTQNCQN